MKKIIVQLLVFCSLFLSGIRAQTYTGDNGDGTYTNPIIPADFPDPDVIRVGDTYYMVTTTMYIFPGVTILKSKDLVNWEYCSNALPRFDFNPAYNLDGGNRYGHGQWATSIKYHNGKFYLLFITLNEGGFMLTSDKVEGSWHITHLPKGFYDPGLFFDDDGKVYVAQGYGKISITEVNDSLEAIGPDSLVFTGDIKGGLEGTHVYKIDGYYYLYCTYGGVNGLQVALRSKNIYGPYEEKLLLQDTIPGVTFGVHQGALIKTEQGEWWTMLFVDSGPFGRFPSLQPVEWKDGWPMIGKDKHGVVTYRKPNIPTSYKPTYFPMSDEFSQSNLGMQWGWNHNPDRDKWSLSERKGYLRLKTAKIVDSFPKAVNTLTQRPFAKKNQFLPTAATIKLDVSKMKPGDVAGLAVFQEPYANIAVHYHNKKSKFIVMTHEDRSIDSVALNANIVYLRTLASNKTKNASFEYSLNNKSFKPLGDTLKMAFSLYYFTGNKFCIFNYATQSLGGFVDVDWFRIQ